MVVIPATTFEIVLSCDATSINFFSIPLIQLSSTLAISCQNKNDLQLLSARAKSDFTVFIPLNDLSLIFILSMSKIKQKKKIAMLLIGVGNFYRTQLKLFQYLPLTFARIHSVYLSIKHERVDSIFDFGTAIK